MSGLRFVAAAVIAGLCLIQPAAVAAPYRAPRTPDGQPDLQGVWTNATVTPLQRPKVMKDLEPTAAEVKTWLQEIKDRRAGKLPPQKPGDPPPEPDVGESEWYADSEGLMRIDERMRSSIITDPADGKLPYNLIGRRAVADALRRDDKVMDNPEDRHSDERCLMALGGAMGPPMLPPVYNAHYTIVQTTGSVAIAAEMIHDVRTIPLNAKHEAGLPRWEGDAVGHWEGETLVVETVRQHPLSVDRFVGAGILHLTPAAVVEERFTRTSPTQIRYAFTVDDPSVFTQPWRGELLFNATAEPAYEYACHEGNYALANILRGARKQEKDAADAAKKPAGKTP